MLAWTRSMSSSDYANKNTSNYYHICIKVIQDALSIISGAVNAYSDAAQAAQDLVAALERAMSSISLGRGASGCQFCLLAPEITRITDRIQSKCNNMMKSHAHLSLHQSKIAHEESMKGLLNDFRILKLQLQSIMDVHEGITKSRSRSSPGILNEAHDLRFDGARFTNVAGDYMADTSSNFTLVIRTRDNSGIRPWDVLFLLLLALVVSVLLFRL